jgi:ADP-ribose pyrophosphatase
MTSTEDGDRHRPDPVFRRTGRELLHQSWIISLWRTTVVGPDGTVFDREIVHHPGAVAVVPITDTGSVLLVRQYRAAVDRWLYEVPAGAPDVAGEPAATTAARELTEEVGRTAGRFDLLTRCLNTPGICDEVTEVFLATDLRMADPDRQGVEERYLTVEEVPLDRFDGLVDDGTIVDAVTILGVALARRRLDRATR